MNNRRLANAKPAKVKLVLYNVMHKMKYNALLIAAVGLSFALGCSRHEETVQPRVGFLSIGTNELYAVIPLGTHQEEVIRRIGKPCHVMQMGRHYETNSTAAVVEIPTVMWTYACTNGNIWVCFGSNSNVFFIGPSPMMEI